LPGEHDEVRKRHGTAGGLALFADFFLDGKDEEIAASRATYVKEGILKSGQSSI
jgi:hypothetical protein